MQPLQRTARLMALSVALVATACATGTGDSSPASDGNVILTAHAAPGSAGVAELTIEIRAQREPTSTRAPIDLVTVLDASESMTRRQSELARTFVRQMIDLLDSDDRFAFITISDRARVEIELAPATESAKRDWRERLRGVRSTGLTNLADGLDTARALASEDAPILLISDGSPTWGAVDRTEVLERAGSDLWTIGVGRHDEALLRDLGHYFHLRDPVLLADTIAREIFADRPPVATDLTLTLEPPRNVEMVEADAHGVQHTRTLRTPLLFEGSARRVAIQYRIVDATEDVGDVTLRYTSTAGTKTLRVENIPIEVSRELAHREPDR